MKINLFYLVLFFNLLNIWAQDPLAVSNINPEMFEGANSVVQLDKHIISVPNRKTLEINKTRIITILNRKGQKHMEAYVNYNNSTRVKEVNAIIYDKNGNELKKYKKKDFKDIAAVDDISLFSDDRLLYLDYTPTSFPYTVKFEYSTISDNTAFLPRFYGNTGFLSSMIEGYYEINANADLGLKYQPYNASDKLNIEASNTKIIATFSNVAAINKEPYSPGFQGIVPRVHFALNKFHYEGVNGNASNWKEFGKWMNIHLLEGTRVLPESTIKKIQSLVNPKDDVKEKIRKVYEFMQNRTRYVSVQVGIGGWKPMLASEVDELGYGDCKALSNYTKALLEAIDIPSFYTVLYGDNTKINIDKNFPSLQGNHAILAVPYDNDYLWLECTDQNVPLNFIANFTDDRDVLLITPEGGKIVHSKQYPESINTQHIEAEVFFSENGTMSTNLIMTSKGVQYNDRYKVEKLIDKKRREYYYSFWDYINNINIEKIQLSNDKKIAQFREEISFNADNYASFIGEDMIIILNTLNRYNAMPIKMNDRNFPIQIKRGFTDQDEVVINLPQGYHVDSLPENVNISNEFGSYTMEIQALDTSQLKYKRKFILKKGDFENEKYISFRKFIKKVIKSDNQKILLKKS